MHPATLAVVAALAPLAVAHPPSLHSDRLLDDGPWLVVDKQDRPDAFRQLEEILPTPNDFRTASGAPGPAYWQQRADHHIKVRIDEERHAISGWQRITYRNESPDALSYLWLQLDQNHFRDGGLADLADPGVDPGRPADPANRRDRRDLRWFRGIVLDEAWSGGFEIPAVRDADGRPLPFTVVDTMMRIDLATPLGPGESFAFEMEWSFPVVPADVRRARSNYELLPDTKLPLYEIAQCFPRMAAYTDVNGWQHKQFLGSGEFTLEFGNYRLEIDAPAGWLVTATGELRNPEETLTGPMRERLEAARVAERPVMIVTAEEARENEKRFLPGGERPEGRTNWVFESENVRDAAFAASPAFAWDAWGVEIPGADGRRAMAMSFYPALAAPLWSLYSTQAVAHALESYSRHAYPYPWPVAISVNGPVGGMEYPMICFNGPRPEPDGTWSAGAKYGLIGVVIHEVGHNWFPMIVNSDERQWTWLDEGLNTFGQFLAEQEWEERYPSGRGRPESMVGHMTSVEQTPIMTNSESTLQFGPSQYGKPATALNILRESVLGRENFDFAFREFCRRWAFKRPQPADFFRTMEDASGVDLDWFWRGWFYSTDHVDVAIEKVVAWTPSFGDPEADKARRRKERDAAERNLSAERNRDLPKRVERFPELADFYSRFDELDVTEADRREFGRSLERWSDDERKVLGHGLHFTVVRFRNVGGLVTFLPLEVNFDDGSVGSMRLPAELWRRNAFTTSKLLVTRKPVRSVRFDPMRETGDADRENNVYPQEIPEKAFEVRKERRERNPMQRARDEERTAKARELAEAIAPVLVAAWEGGGGDRGESPMAAAGRLTEAVRSGGLLAAPEGMAVRLEFGVRAPAGGEDPSRVSLATVVVEDASGAGAWEDRAAERPHPARFAIGFDGSVKPARE
jgi:hypothetical protein